MKRTWPVPGSVLVLADEDYRFGVGALLCRVLVVLDELDLDDGPPWWHIKGECAQGSPTHHGSWHVRELYVISSALHQVWAPRTAP